MITGLKGIVEHLAGQEVAINVQDVSYLVHVTAACRERLVEGELAQLVVYTDVQESSIRLYGFSDRLELQIFKLLIKVSGVGARSASDILSKIDKLELLKALSTADLAKLKAVKGIGPKTAERLVVELKDRVQELIAQSRLQIKASPHGHQLEEAKLAMQSLGFTQRTISDALARFSEEELTLASGEIVRLALGRL